MQINPIISKEDKYTAKAIFALKKKKGVKVIDMYLQQIEELLGIQKPQLSGKELEKAFSAFKKEKTIKDKDLRGDWIYYPWSNTLLHTVTEKENDLLRTNRNKNIITPEEQERLRNLTISLAGLSVGGNIATTLVYNGFPKHLKLADFDTLETTNLNRVRGKLSDVGELKINIISRQLFEIDPYLKVTNFNKGLNEKNVKKFVENANLVFEIIDDLKLKILIRKEAQLQRVPVVMLTSIGDSVMIDVERYDIDPSTKIFNGLVDEKVLDDILHDKVPKSEINKYVVQIVGTQNIPPKVMESVRQIGKTLSGRPQLMSTVTVASGLASFIARKISLRESVPSGRSLFRFDDLLKESES